MSRVPLIALILPISLPSLLSIPSNPSSSIYLHTTGDSIIHQLINQVFSSSTSLLVVALFGRKIAINSSDQKLVLARLIKIVLEYSQKIGATRQHRSGPPSPRGDCLTSLLMTNESIEEEDEKTGQTDLTFKLDIPGNWCRTAFAILAMIPFEAEKLQ